MFKKVIISAALLMCVNANAMDLTVTLGSDMKANKNRLNVVYQACEPNARPTDAKCKGQTLNGLQPQFIEPFLASLKKTLTPFQPDGSEWSYITLGYIKNNVGVSPASCQKVILRPVMNIQMTEAGCVVS